MEKMFREAMRQAQSQARRDPQENVRQYSKEAKDKQAEARRKFEEEQKR